MEGVPNEVRLLHSSQRFLERADARRLRRTQSAPTPESASIALWDSFRVECDQRKSLKWRTAAGSLTIPFRLPSAVVVALIHEASSGIPVSIERHGDREQIGSSPNDFTYVVISLMRSVSWGFLFP
jgi:hypothetical protein